MVCILSHLGRREQVSREIHVCYTLVTKAMHSLSVATSNQHFATLVAQAVARIYEQKKSGKHRFSLALAGGNTPLAAYKELVENTKTYAIDWRRVRIFLSDERVVPSTHPESNQSHVQPLFAPTQAQTFWPDTASAHPDQVADAYEQTILNEVLIENEVPAFDCILLGIGPDGHTASIFPESEELVHPSKRLVIPVVDSPKPPANRVSFSLRLINNAKQILILATGEQKAHIVKSVVLEDAEALAYPITHVKPAHGMVRWIVDQSAASQLPPGVLK
jgi:6-phosphogluconolactonase